MDFKRSTDVEPLHSRISRLAARVPYLLLAITLIFFASVAPLKAEPFALSLATGDDYPPYTDIELPHGGLATKLVRIAFEETGHFVREISWLPWKRGLTLTKRGEYHATFPYGWTEERAELFHYSDPFLPVTLYAWSRAGTSNNLTNEEDLHGLVYCNPRGYGDFGRMQELLDRNLLRRETPNTLKQCFKMLQVKRVDFVSVTRSDALFGLTDAGMSPDEVQQSGFPIAESSHHVIVSKQLPRALEIMDAFNAGFKILKEDGRYDALKEDFGWAN